MTDNPRQLALVALRSVDRGAFSDVALDQVFRDANLTSLDKRLLTELVYGCVRRQRTLDALIDQLGKKSSQAQPPKLRRILHLGLYQLRYLSQIPASAAVNTTVDLAKANGLAGLAQVVNGILRQYVRLSQADASNPDRDRPDPLQVTADPIAHLAIQHSYPDWIVQVWLEQFGWEKTAALCDWMNQSPTIDLRINPLRRSIEQVEAAFTEHGLKTQRLPGLPQALRLSQSVGAIDQLPGFQDGWWMVQDASAQWVGHLLDPQPGDTVIDACAAPGGKTLHMAELMGDRGTIWACDKTASRLKRLQQNCDRLGIQSIRIHIGESQTASQFQGQADRVLVDAPCSGLGTLHRHADARWRQTPDTVRQLVSLQLALLDQAATWLKPSGQLVYATCTLHPAENEAVILSFLDRHPHWQIVPPQPESPLQALATAEGWIKVFPPQHQMDGFFMVRLACNSG